MTIDTLERDRPETDWKYPGWKIVLAGFFGVMVSFAAIVPYTFGLFVRVEVRGGQTAGITPHTRDSALPQN